ncbi:hypothetical protein EDB89DRAFT_2074291 [Lactarius sanguifluus]|nr:hypothetical protein EDB89DRAFT_2074291 [Lactarius sanguifluus]
MTPSLHCAVLNVQPQRRFKQPQNLDIKDTPGLMYSPSTISSTSQSSIPISVCGGWGRPSKGAISHIPSVPLSQPLAITPISRYLSSQRRRVTRQHYLQARHGLHRFARLILLPAHVRDIPERANTPPMLAHSAYPHSSTPRPSPRFHLHRHRTSASWCPPHRHSSRAAHGSPDSRRTNPAFARLGARRLPSSHASRSASAPLRSVHSTAHLELSADDANVCTPRLVVLVTTLALSALMLPAFDTELLAAVLGALASHATRRHAALHVLRPSSTTFSPRLPARVSHTSRSPFAGVPSAPAPRLAILDSSPSLAAALAPNRPLGRVTLRISSTLYDGLRPAAVTSPRTFSLT